MIYVKDFLSAVAVAAFLFLILLLFPARSAETYVCDMWSRDLVRAEVLTSRPAKIGLTQGGQIVSVELDDRDDEMLSLDPETLDKRLLRYWSVCLLQEMDEVPLPSIDKSVWLAEIKILSSAKMDELREIGSVPATDRVVASGRRPWWPMSCQKGRCLRPGSEEWRAFCREHWPRTYREKDDTVVRPGNSERVPCPA